MEMEHATFVPVTPARMTRALRAPSAVAASLPGWQPDDRDDRDAPGDSDASASPPAESPGRLRLRVAGSTITYRGTLAVEGDEPPFVLTARGEEVRGTGTAALRLEVDLAAATHPEPGTDVTFTGTAEAGGRLASYEGAVVDAALRRLLDRFCAQLGENAPEAEPENTSEKTPEAEPENTSEKTPEAAPEAASETASEAVPEAPEPHADHPDHAAHADHPDHPDHPDHAEDAAPPEEPDVVDDDGLAVADDAADADEIELVEVEVEVPESAAALDDLVSPAEAAHARRTMIGRSAEEVDHAPPRGRYAPEPAPDTVSAAATLRWAAPAAAALLASAVVVGRVLRRRR